MDVFHAAAFEHLEDVVGHIGVAELVDRLREHARDI